MWGAFARQVFAYLLTRRGKRALAFVGMLMLGFTTALLLDMQLYISSAFTGTLCFVLVTMWGVQYVRVKQQDRAREIRRLEAATQRLVIAQQRNERYDRAREKVADAVRSAGANTVHTFESGVSAVESGVSAVASAATAGVASGVSAAKSGVASGVSAVKSAALNAGLGVTSTARRLQFWKRPREIDGSAN